MFLKTPRKGKAKYFQGGISCGWIASSVTAHFVALFLLSVVVASQPSEFKGVSLLETEVPTLTSRFQSLFNFLELIKWITLQIVNHATVLFHKTNKEEPSCVCFMRKFIFCCLENVSCDDCHTALIFMLYLEFQYLNFWQFLFFIGDK